MIIQTPYRATYYTFTLFRIKTGSQRTSIHGECGHGVRRHILQPDSKVTASSELVSFSIELSSSDAQCAHTRANARVELSYKRRQQRPLACNKQPPNKVPTPSS